MAYEEDFGFQRGNSMADRQRREIEKPIVCEECGSNWFQEANFNQYSDIAFGSGTGGDIRVISNTQQMVRVCVCGKTFAPNLTGVRGRAATADIESFQKSLKLATTHRNKITEGAAAASNLASQPKPAALSLDKLAQTFASIDEIKSGPPGAARTEDAARRGSGSEERHPGRAGEAYEIGRGTSPRVVCYRFDCGS